MKKITVLLVIMAFSIGLSFGQSEYKKFRFGIYGDLGIGWIKPKTTDYSKAGASMTFGYGFDFDYYFSKNYVFNSGIYVNYMGGELSYLEKKDINGSTINGTLVRDYSLQYIEIPVSIKLKTSQMGYLTYFVQVGLNAGLRLNASCDDSYEFSTGNLVTKDIDLESNTSLFKLSFAPAIGAEYEVNQSLSIYSSLTFNNGMTDFLTGKNGITGTAEKAILNKFGISVGLYF